MVFDIPSKATEPFEKRIEFLRKNFAHCEFVKILDVHVVVL